MGEVKSTPELALRFVLSNPGVTVALSGMRDLKMLEENVATVEKSGDLSAEDQIDPVSFEVDSLRAYARRHKDASVRVRPPLEALSLDAVLSFDGTRSMEHLHHIVAAAKAADA